MIIRPQGWDAPDYEATLSLNKPGFLYRGMTEDEYRATVGARQPIQSTGQYSFSSEGTNFADEFAIAEDYVDFGRDDPRKTGRPNFVVEIDPQELNIQRNRQGYYEAFGPVPFSAVTRIWRLEPQKGALVAVEIPVNLKAKLLR